MDPAVHAPDTWRIEATPTKYIWNQGFLEVIIVIVNVECDSGRKVSFHTVGIHWWAPWLQRVCYSQQVWELGNLDRTAPENIRRWHIRRTGTEWLSSALFKYCWWIFLNYIDLLSCFLLPSCMQTPSWQKGERGRAKTCFFCVCGNLFYSSGFWRRCDPVCEASVHTAPHLDWLQYRYLKEVDTKR